MAKPQSRAKQKLSPLLAELVADAKEWVSFTDGEGDTWMFDLTFLASNYTCIYGAGCEGIDDDAGAEAELGCCAHGAHFEDEHDQEATREKAKRLTKEIWQHMPEDLDDAFGTEGDAAVTTTVDGGCIFLNRPGFSGGTGCALHIGALAAGQRPLDWKPTVCWQLPLRLDELEDDNGNNIWILRSWDRKDWGDGGYDFQWWCTEHSSAFIGQDSAVYTLREEIVEMVGDDAYNMLLGHLETRGIGSVAPHPASVPVELKTK